MALLMIHIGSTTWVISNSKYNFLYQGLFGIKFIYHSGWIRGLVYIWEDFPRTDNSLSKCHKCFIFNLQIKYEGNELWFSNFHHAYRIVMRVQKCQKIEKIILGTFSKSFSKIVEIFFENRRNAAVKRRFLKNIFKMFPKLFF